MTPPLKNKMAESVRAAIGPKVGSYIHPTETVLEKIAKRGLQGHPAARRFVAAFATIEETDFETAATTVRTEIFAVIEPSHACRSIYGRKIAFSQTLSNSGSLVADAAATDCRDYVLRQAQVRDMRSMVGATGIEAVDAALRPLIYATAANCFPSVHPS